MSLMTITEMALTAITTVMIFTFVVIAILDRVLSK